MSVHPRGWNWIQWAVIAAIFILALLATIFAGISSTRHSVKCSGSNPSPPPPMPEGSAGGDELLALLEIGSTSVSTAAGGFDCVVFKERAGPSLVNALKDRFCARGVPRTNPVADCVYDPFHLCVVITHATIEVATDEAFIAVGSIETTVASMTGTGFSNNKLYYQLGTVTMDTLTLTMTSTADDTVISNNNGPIPDATVEYALNGCPPEVGCTAGPAGATSGGGPVTDCASCSGPGFVLNGITSELCQQLGGECCVVGPNEGCFNLVNSSCTIDGVCYGATGQATCESLGGVYADGSACPA